MSAGRVVLDWSAGSIGQPAPCVLCNQKTVMRSPRGVPCHKICAEDWTSRRTEETLKL